MRRLILSGLLLIPLAGCVTEGDPKSVQNFAAPVNPTVDLELVKVTQMAPSYKQPFELSGLVVAANRVFAVSRREKDAVLFEVVDQGPRFDLKPRYRLTISGAPNIEGVDFCGGDFFVVNQRDNSFFDFAVKSKQTIPITLDFKRFYQNPSLWAGRQGYSGVAVNCLQQTAYLIKGREPRMIIRVDLKKNEIQETFNFAEIDGNDYSDAKFENGFLYLLERSGNVIAKVDPETKRVIQKVSFKNQLGPSSALFATPGGNLVEALVFRGNEIWLGIDSGGMSVTALGKNKYDLRPKAAAIFHFKRPEGF